MIIVYILLKETTNNEISSGEISRKPNHLSGTWMSMRRPKSPISRMGLVQNRFWKYIEVWSKFVPCFKLTKWKLIKTLLIDVLYWTSIQGFINNLRTGHKSNCASQYNKHYKYTECDGKNKNNQLYGWLAVSVSIFEDMRVERLWGMPR